MYKHDIVYKFGLFMGNTVRRVKIYNIDTVEEAEEEEIRLE